MSAQAVQKHEVSDSFGPVNDQNRMAVQTPAKASFLDVYLLGIKLHYYSAVLIFEDLFNYIFV